MTYITFITVYDFIYIIKEDCLYCYVNDNHIVHKNVGTTNVRKKIHLGLVVFTYSKQHEFKDSFILGVV